MRPTVEIPAARLPFGDDRAPEPTHPCVRCGAAIGLDEAICDRCNPTGLAQPATSQAHGTILLAIALSVAALAFAGHIAISGVGPFSGSIARMASTPEGREITITVTNGGTRAGSSTCRVFDPTVGGIAPDSAYLLSPPVPAGGSVAFTGRIPAASVSNPQLAVDCR